MNTSPSLSDLRAGSWALPLLSSLVASFSACTWNYIGKFKCSNLIPCLGDHSRRALEGQIKDHCRHFCTPVHPSPSTLGVVTSPNPKFLVKSLTTKEMTVKHNKGLYYQCDEKWIIRHRCKPCLHLFIADDDKPSDWDHPNTEPPTCADDTPPLPQVSFNTLSRISVAETFRLYDHIRHHRVTILMDGESTHNFIQSRVAKFLTLPVTPTPTLHVMVRNGNRLTCDTICPKLTLSFRATNSPLTSSSFPFTVLILSSGSSCSKNWAL